MPPGPKLAEAIRTSPSTDLQKSPLRTRQRNTATSAKRKAILTLPTLTVAAEQYNMLVRLAKAGGPVELRIQVVSRFNQDRLDSDSVIAEIPGADRSLRDEVVLVGAHLDSWHTATGARDNAARDIPAGAIVYTVQPGDNLVRTADRFYADGDKWQLLYETNQGRQMADGRPFDRAGVIQPGWQLVVTEPAIAIETDANGRRWYTVRRGDSLAGISARLLGDESR